MSADNILIILRDKKTFYVYDVNFSDISSHEAWNFPLSVAQSLELTKYIRNSRYWLLHEADTEGKCESFCLRHMRTEVVEYEYSSIVVNFDPR